MKNFLDRATDYKPAANNFKFYVSADQELQDISKSSEEISLEKPKPKLLDREVIVCIGKRVLFFPNVADKTKGFLGNLYVTNFRFMFDAYEEDNFNEEESIHQKNNLLGDHGACLTNVEALYHVWGDKKRKLSSEYQLLDRVKGLQIICKNLKVFTFNFDQTPITERKSVTQTLLHYAFPVKHYLLFAYEFSNAKLKPPKLAEGVVLFSERSEWENELTRTCSIYASHWRITTQNQRFQVSSSLPKWLVVPHSVLDYDFVTASQSFRCNRAPIWTWSSPNGAALVRMADLLPTITDRTQENRMLENVRKCHPQLKGPCIKYLDKDLPSVTELHQSYEKLKDLCTPDSHRKFKLQDSHLYSQLENTKWLQHVSSCLKVAAEASKEIRRGTTVVLQESDGRDTSAIISSLVQLVLDPHTRSILGFQSLIQKEWIALGHPFCKRLGHLRTNTSEQSPVFLLFLDCVWQLVNQFPSNFEFTETYLTTLWDSVHVSIFDTFLFDCEKDRMDAFLNETERLVPRSVWNWDQQFSGTDIELFKNPLYKFSRIQDMSHSDGDKSRQADSILLPECSIIHIELWMQCYFRWLPLLSIKSGGRPQVDIVHRQLMKDIHSLLSEIQEISKKNAGSLVYNPSNNNINNNNSNINNNSSDPNDKRNNVIYSITTSCSTSSSNNTQNSNMYDFSRLHINDENSCDAEVSALLKNRDVIDNFFPFTISSTTCVSNTLTNSSNLSEFESHSILNLTN